jgi:hypothetical protein
MRRAGGWIPEAIKSGRDTQESQLETAAQRTALSELSSTPSWVIPPAVPTVFCGLSPASGAAIVASARRQSVLVGAAGRRILA